MQAGLSPALFDAGISPEVLFEHAFSHAPIGMAVLAPDGRFLAVNATLCGALRISADQLLRWQIRELILSEASELEPVLTGAQERVRFEARCRRRDGQPMWAQIDLTFIQNADGGPQFFIMQLQDVTVRRVSNRAPHQTAARLESMLMYLNEAIVIEDELGRIVEANQLFCDTFHIPAPPAALIGMEWSESARDIKAQFEHADAFPERIAAIIAAREPVIAERLKTVDGRYLERDFLPVWVGSQCGGHIWIYRDVTDQIQARQALAAQAQALARANVTVNEQPDRDALTGLANRRALFDFLYSIIDRARRTRTPISLVLIDVDNFAAFNETYGTEIGDAVIQEIAAILRRTVRGSDFVARVGGEEFVVVLCGASDEQSLHVAERYRLAIAAAPWPHQSITASLGVASIGALSSVSDVDHTCRELLLAADRAVDRAKDKGRNRVVVEPPLHPIRRRHAAS
ncbi:MAG: diguanylate cyclase [Myxococcota bacterium]